MVLNLHPKCANPSCAAAFDWIAGGKLFRFRRDDNGFQSAGAEGEATSAGRLAHFWLCERCSNLFKLQYQAGKGIVILPLWPQLPPAEEVMRLPAA